MARRSETTAPGTAQTPEPVPTAAQRAEDSDGFGSEELRQRLGALRELIGLSRTRLDAEVLAEAGRVLEEAGERGRLPRACTTVAIAGATGSGKSTLFNALADARLSEAGTSRPTTAAPVACTWQAPGHGGEADGLLERLGIAPSARRRMSAPDLNGLVLIDLPDHDSAAAGHREQVDRLLKRVDAVVWVVDPEKYADAVLHESYLRPLAGYAEVTFVVLNQTDRLPGEAADTVLDDLRRLLDEDGMALGEHGEPGARVLAASALTGTGVAELREEIGAFVAEQRAPALRLNADVDGVVGRLRPVYADPGPGSGADGPVGLTDVAREEFEDRLASAVGAVAAGQAAERAWLRNAERTCGTPWAQLAQWYDARRPGGAAGEEGTDSGPDTAASRTAQPRSHATGRRTPGATGFAASCAFSGEGVATDTAGESAARPGVAVPVVAQAVRELSEEASDGLPDAWRRSVRDAARRGADGLPEALDEVMRERDAAAGAGQRSGEEPRGRSVAAAAMTDGRRTDGAHPPRPSWWTAAALTQVLLLVLQLASVVWLVAAAAGASGDAGWLPVALLLGGSAGGPLLAWACRVAARGPARTYGQEEERRLRRLAAGCGRSRVLEPVASELLRYREVREQYVIAAGGTRGVQGMGHEA